MHPLKIALWSQTVPTHFWIISALSCFQKKKTHTHAHRERAERFSSVEAMSLHECKRKKKSAQLRRLSQTSVTMEIMWQGQEVSGDMTSHNMTAAPDSWSSCVVVRHTHTHTWGGDSDSHTHGVTTRSDGVTQTPPPPLLPPILLLSSSLHPLLSSFFQILPLLGVSTENRSSLSISKGTIHTKNTRRSLLRPLIPHAACLSLAPSLLFLSLLSVIYLL